MFPILLMLGAQVGSSVMLNKKSFDEDLDNPKIFGMPARVVMGGAGLLAMFLGGPFAYAGAAVLGSTISNWDATKRVADGIKTAVKTQIDAALAEQRSQLQLPGPSVPDQSPELPVPDEGGQGDGSVGEWFRSLAA